MVSNALVEELRALSAAEKPTPQQFLDLVNGWDRLFARLRLAPEAHLGAFRTILMARVKAGAGVSLEAPDTP